MFGEKEIVGKRDIKFDANNRFYLPKFTHREPGDKIYPLIFKQDGQKILKLVSYNDYQNMIQRYDGLMKTSSSEEECEKYKNILNYLYNNLLSFLIVNKRKQILLPVFLVEYLNWENDKNYECQGINTSLLISEKNTTIKR